MLADQKVKMASLYSDKKLPDLICGKDLKKELLRQGSLQGLADL
jgi:hypothetical protein